MKLKKITSALVSAGVLALAGAAGTAQAGAMAGAMVDMTNFQILKGVGGAGGIVSTADLLNLSFTSTMDYQAGQNGALPINVTDSVSTGPGIDKPAACVGTGCVGVINFTTNNLFPQPAAPVQGNYAAVDQLEVGSPISGLTGYVGLAHVANAAYVGLQTGSGSATAASNNNLNASWTFTAGFTGPLTFDFDLLVYLQAQLDAAEQAPTFATANWDVNFTLICLSGAACAGAPGGVVSPQPGGIPFKTISLNSPAGSGIEFFFSDSDHFSLAIPVIAGLRYQLSARINTLADLERIVVPEPGVLALLGLGLLGLGATLRKKVALS